jgi:hypothetical protein
MMKDVLAEIDPRENDRLAGVYGVGVMRARSCEVGVHLLKLEREQWLKPAVQPPVSR